MIIQRCDASLALELATCDFSFDITSEAAPPFCGTSIDNVVSVAPYTKAYRFDVAKFAARGSERALFSASESDRLLGYIAVSRGWNSLASVDDLAVARAWRGIGVGWSLMDAAVSWAKESGLPGVRAETQSNNIPACRFYESYGFELGGYDRHLYSAIQDGRPEIALFWYLFFREKAT